MAKIELKKLSKTFGDVDVIRAVDLTINAGEFMVFVGPSGCGKSTLLRLICGLEDITSGELLFDDVSMNDKVPSERGIAMVFQSYALYPHMSVYKNMAFGLKLANFSNKEMQARVLEAAKMLQIDHLLDRLPKQLSGGQRQRVAIGRAIVRDPRVFLFDEPLSNLDASLRVDTRLEIAKLHHKMKDATMVYVTHDQVEAMTLADRICVLRDGNIEQVGTPEELYHSPKSLFVAGFIGSPKMNFITGDIADQHQCHTLGIRPEHLLIDAEKGVWKGKVIHTENLGSDFFVYLDMGTGEPLVVRLDGQERIPLDTQVHVRPLPARLHRFDVNGLPITPTINQTGENL
ncbi:ABC transporter ATP-binding protein [Marinomonas sp. M1K-6]|uniref:ABC transporter ATP-binding protein n=1 Tax=Marinomonas profundi TaxID=2726122 RepID=A0A847R0Q9_9GAMM|nr:ABC transporter ATP-binding protein [Marinomonas profundi]NLQ17102.1 ABC transporter ATP-binding protein [Marinomonas profundi]UDV04701.1 ABC transporter ATP-binding protein [Marinomonas profundi]